MICNIILSKKRSRFFARVKEWPEITAEEVSREDAIRKIKVRLSEFLESQGEIVQIEIPSQSEERNPWIETFGMFRDDPTFEDLQEEIRKNREIDNIPASE